MHAKSESESEYEKNVQKIIQRLLKSLLQDKPEDPVAYLYLQMEKAESQEFASSGSFERPLHERSKSETDRMVREAIHASPKAMVQSLNATSRRGVHRRRGSEVMARDNYKIAAVSEVQEEFSEEPSLFSVKEKFQKAMMLSEEDGENSKKVSAVVQLMMNNEDNLEYQHFACEALAE